MKKNKPCKHDWAYNTNFLPTERVCIWCKRKENRQLLTPMVSYFDYQFLPIDMTDWRLLIKNIKKS